MSTLTGSAVATTYYDLVHLNNSGSGLDSNWTAFTDGNGNTLPMRVKTNAIDFQQQLWIGGEQADVTGGQVTRVAADLSVSYFKTNALNVPDRIHVGASSSDNEHLKITEGEASTTLDVRFEANDSAVRLYGNTNRTSGDVPLLAITGEWNGSTVAAVELRSGDDTTNKDDGRIVFMTASSSASLGEAGEFAPNGDFILRNATEDIQFKDAGSAGATEQDWIEVEIGGVTGYVRVYATK